MSSRPKALRRTRYSGAFGLALSLALHVLAYSVLRWAGTAPSVDFELSLPAEIELGMTEAARVEPTPSAPASAAPAPEPPPKPTDAPVPDQGPVPDAGAPRDASLVDAEVADAAREPDAARDAAPPDAGPADAATQPLPPTKDAGRPLLSAYAPKGAQIALRLHMGRVRDSPLAADVRALLAAIPDWQLLLEGSGIDPMAQLERVFIASPNLQRSSIVVVGEYRGDTSIPRAAVARLAQDSGNTARWRKHGGIPVAPWHNRDATRRIVALIAAKQFAIVRPEDLPRIVVIARALAAREQKRGGGNDSQAFDALLGLRQQETLAVSVEGARNFARGNLRGVPERLEASVEQPKDGPLQVRVQAFFETPEAARKALEYWRSMKRRLESHPLLAFSGLRRPVAGAQLEAVQEELKLETRVTHAQARMLLEFARNAMTPPKPPPTAPGRAPAPPAEHKRPSQ